jgi:hypothetical protein
MKMNDWGVPMSGLKPAATVHKIKLQSFATRHSLSSGSGLQPALPGSIFGAILQYLLMRSVFIATLFQSDELSGF